MRNFRLLFLLLFPVNIGFTQTFYATPDPVLEQEILPEQANECYIFFENASGDTLQLRWKTIETSFPEQWDIDLCDLGACYVGIPASGLMIPASGPEQPYLKLIVQPGAVPGAAWLWFRVSEAGQPANFVDVFFSLFTSGVSATETAMSPQIRVFPNPTSGALWLKNLQESSIPVRLFDAGGQIRWANTLQDRQEQTLDLSGWPAGPYYLQAAGKTQVILRLP